MRSMVVVRNVVISTFSDEIHVDAVIDTGSTLCVVPPIFARRLGFEYSNRLDGGPVNVIGGGSVQMDVHRLEWVRVGSAKAYDVKMGVQKTFAGSGSSACSGNIFGNRQMLVMRTIEDPANPLGELVSSQRITLRLHYFALAVNPFGFYGVKPWTLLGKKATHDPHPLCALLDFSIL